MEYTVTPLTGQVGAEVRGLDLTGIIDPETRQALNRAFADHHVLVIRDQNFTPPQFIAAKRFAVASVSLDKKFSQVGGWTAELY